MNLFQGVLKGLSDDLGSIGEIAEECLKNKNSVENEIKRLKQVSNVGRWIMYDVKSGKVRLVEPLRGIGLEALEFLVKQFYKSDRRLGKKFDSHHKNIPQNLDSSMSEFDTYVNNYIDKEGILTL